MFFGLGNAYAQVSLAEIASLVREIDSLKKANKTFVITNDSLKKVISANGFRNKQQSENQEDIIEALKKELSDLEKFKSNKKANEITLVAKSDSIKSLKKQITEKDNEIKTITVSSKKDADAEKENGKNEVLNILVNIYKNNSFDELINSSSIASVQRDRQIIGNNTDVKQIFTDLEIYFNCKNLLSNKYNAEQVNNAKSQVTLIKQQSKLVAALKNNLDNFKTFNEGLNAAIKNIIAIDIKIVAKGMPEGVVKGKLDKVLSELSKFIFDYNFNFVDYPYFSDIVLDIIKRKQPNPDADISDLLKKIE